MKFKQTLVAVMVALSFNAVADIVEVEENPKYVRSFFTMELEDEAEYIEEEAYEIIEEEKEVFEPMIEPTFAMEEEREVELIEPQFYDGFFEPDDKYTITVVDDIPVDTEPEEFKHVSLVSFDINKSTLSKSAKERLKKVVELYKQNQDQELEVEVIGHADSTGSLQFNHDLASNRALAAVTYLIDQGVKVDDVYMSAMAFNNPALGERGNVSERNAEIIVKSR